jgi:xanthine dehydrogenase/oxidase
VPSNDIAAPPTLSNVRIVFGAIASAPVIASKTMAALEGGPLDGSNLAAAITALVGELSDAVVAEPAYATADNPAGKLAERQAVLAPFLYKWYVRAASAYAPSVVPTSIVSAGQQALPDARPAISASQTFPKPSYAPVGEAMPKLTALQQASGEAKYVSDMDATSMLHAAAVASTRPLAVVSKIDFSAAKAAFPDQVVAFITADDIPGNNDICAETCGPLPNKYQPGMAPAECILVPEGGTTTWVGERLALVVATSRRVAFEAAKLVQVTYSDLPDGSKPILTLADSIAAKKYWSLPTDYDLGLIESGDVESSLKSAPHTLSGIVPSGGITHFYMEKQSAVAIPQEGQRMEVHSSTQNPDGCRRAVAIVLGVDGSKVTAKMRRAGGAYGGKLTRSLPVAALAAVAAHKTGRPVRFVLDIYHDQQTNSGRLEFQSHYQVGFDDSGKLLAVDINAYAGGSAIMDGIHDSIAEFNTSADCCYHISDFRVQTFPCSLNRAPNTALRAPGHVQSSFLMESIIDAVALDRGLDVQTVRETNFYNARNAVTPFFQKIIPFTLPDVWQALQSQADIGTRKKAISTFNAANKWRKRALVCMPVKYGVTRFQSNALVNIESDGSVTVSHAQTEVGQGIHTRVAQVAAYTLGCPLDVIHVTDTNTEVTPNAQMTGGSMGTGQATEAVRVACLKLKLRLSPCRETLGLSDGVLSTADWKSLTASASENTIDLACSYMWPGSLGSSSMNNFGPWGIGVDGVSRDGNDVMSYFNFGAGCSEVEVDILSGEHTVLRTDIYYDCGTPMNPMLDIGQMEGAFVMGLGFYTREEQLWHADGKNAADGTWEYKPPCAYDVPQEFNVTILPNLGFEKGTMRAKATGEPPKILSYSIFSAIRAAISESRKERGHTGPTNLKQPATPTNVIAAAGVTADELTLK